MANQTKTNKGMRYGRRKKRRKKIEEHGVEVPFLTEGLGLLLLQDAALLIEEQPASGLVNAKNLRDGFGNHLRCQKTVEVRRLAACFEVMSVFLEAFAIRLLGDPEKAIAILGSNAPECDKCAAEYHRFLAAFRKDTGQPEVAESELRRSLDIYSKIQGSGHNLSENGIGSCLFLLAHIKHSAGDNAAAIDLASKAIKEIDPQLEASRSLYFSAIGNLSIYFFFADRVDEAEDYLSTAESHWSSTAKVTGPRMLCLWLRGLIFARRGHEGTAKRYLENAFECAHVLGYQREATMIKSDFLALLVLTGSSFWLLSKTLCDLPVPKSASGKVDDLKKAIDREDMQDTWIGIRSVRHYSDSNALVVPYVLPEMKIL